MKRNAPTIGLQEAVDGFLFSLTAEGKANRTIEYYEGCLRHFLAYAQTSNWSGRIEDIDSHKVRQFLTWVSTRTLTHQGGNGAQMVRKAKASTARPYYKTLRRFFNWAIQEGFVDSNPLSSIHFKSPAEAPVEGYTQEEVQHLLAVCDLDIRTGARFTGIRNKAMLLLFLDSGLRRAEMANLTLRDLDLDSRRVRVLGKGNKIGIVPFSAKTAKALWAWLMERKARAKTDRLWITEEGRAFSIDGLDSWFGRLKRRAGVHSAGGVHRLRHTAALQYLRGARDSFLLQLFLRHESLEMSRRYTKGLKAEEAIEAHRNGASPVEGLGLG